MSESVTGELDDQTKVLLRGILTKMYKQRKHPERYLREGATEESVIIDESDGFDLGQEGTTFGMLTGKQIEDIEWNKLSREE